MPGTSVEILRWLNEFGHRLDFQRDPRSGSIKAVGGHSIWAAVIKPAVRLPSLRQP